MAGIEKSVEVGFAVVYDSVAYIQVAKVLQDGRFGDAYAREPLQTHGVLTQCGKDLFLSFKPTCNL
jgi:hypothetical protein